MRCRRVGLAGENRAWRGRILEALYKLPDFGVMSSVYGGGFS